MTAFPDPDTAFPVDGVKSAQGLYDLGAASRERFNTLTVTTGGVLVGNTRATGVTNADSGDPAREQVFTRAACAEFLIDAGAVVAPPVCDGLIASRAKGLIDLFHRRGLLPRSLKFLAALGDVDGIRTSLDTKAGDLAAVNEAFMYACHLQHAAAAALLLDRAITLDAELGRRIDGGPGRSAFVQYFISNKPDVVVMDLVMPGKSGIEGMPAVLQAAPEVKVLVLSMQDDPRYVREAFEVGAAGYVLKEAADTEVVGALRAVAAGERYVHPTLGARLVAAEAEERKRAEADPLSEREREVLRLLALGHTNQEIAKMLYISVRTAETHRAHIMQKLRLSSRAELVRYALENGLIEG